MNPLIIILLITFVAAFKKVSLLGTLGLVFPTREGEGGGEGDGERERERGHPDPLPVCCVGKSSKQALSQALGGVGKAFPRYANPTGLALVCVLGAHNVSVLHMAGLA